jgi:6-phosphogluconolactonase
MRLFSDYSKLSRAASDIFVTSAHRAIAERGRFLVALSGGTTPVALYRQLVTAAMDWGHAHVFWGDERCVPVQDAGSNYGQARQVLLSHVPLPARNIHRIKGELKPPAAARDYAAVLKRFAEPPLDWPRFDLVLLGMGEDGHVASLFPGSPADTDSPVLAVTADYQDRPADRVTLTPLVFNSARHILLLVSGAGKSQTLASVLKGDARPDRFPAQRIHPAEGRITWLVDAQAGALL